MQDHPAVELLHDWFNRGQSGCKFASHLASGEPRLGLWVHLDPVTAVDLEDLDSHCDSATRQDYIAVLVFPRISSDCEIIELARHLQTSSRWTIGSSRHPSDPSLLGLSIRYQTQTGAYSSAMGFAPSGKMPVTRRAPYTMLALWAGERKNEFFRHGPRGLVGLGLASPGSLLFGE